MTFRRSRLLAVALTCAVTTSLAACTGVDPTPDAADQPGASEGASPAADESKTPEVPPVTVMANVERGARDVPVDTRLTLEADGGTLRKVAVSSAAGEVPGKMSGDNITWVAQSLLEPGTDYAVTTVARRSADGADRHAAYALPHRRPDPGPADLPVGGAARGRDGRRGHAGHRHLRRRR